MAIGRLSMSNPIVVYQLRLEEGRHPTEGLDFPTMGEEVTLIEMGIGIVIPRRASRSGWIQGRIRARGRSARRRNRPTTM